MNKGLVIDNKGFRVAKNKDHVAARMERLFFTQEGGILGHPGWGSAILDFLFDSQDDITVNEILSEMEFLLGSRDLIPIESVSAEILNDGSNSGLVLKVNAFVDIDEEPEELEFFRVVEIQ